MRNFRLYFLNLILFFGCMGLPLYAQTAAQSLYYRFYPDVITNAYHDGVAHHVLLRIEVMVANAEDSAIVEYHEPLLRDALIQMINGIDYKQLREYEGRKAFQSKALIRVQELLKTETGKPVAEKILFTRVVVE